MAKLGIALGSGPRDLGFESRHSDQRNRNPHKRVPAFDWVKGGFEQSYATVQRTVACRRLDGGNTMILIPKGIKMQRIPTLRPEIAPAAAGAFFHSMHPSAQEALTRLHACFGFRPKRNCQVTTAWFPSSAPCGGTFPQGKARLIAQKKFFYNNLHIRLQKNLHLRLRVKRSSKGGIFYGRRNQHSPLGAAGGPGG